MKKAVTTRSKSDRQAAVEISKTTAPAVAPTSSAEKPTTLAQTSFRDRHGWAVQTMLVQQTNGEFATTFHKQRTATLLNTEADDDDGVHTTNRVHAVETRKSGGPVSDIAAMLWCVDHLIPQPLQKQFSNALREVTK